MLAQTVRYLKILLTMMVGLFGLIAAAQNLIQMDTDLALVSQVVSGGGAAGVAQWQQIQSPLLVTLCWLVIPVAKTIAGVLCFLGVHQMWAARAADAAQFQAAKQAAIAGCGVLLAMLFGVFILISETWFQQWQTELGGAILSAAERYIIALGIVLFFVNLEDTTPA